MSHQKIVVNAENDRLRQYKALNHDFSYELSDNLLILRTDF